MKTIGILSSRDRKTEADYQLLHQAFAVLYQTGDVIATLACLASVDKLAERLASEYETSVLSIFRADTVTKSTRNRQFIIASTLFIALPPVGITAYFSGTLDLLKTFRASHAAKDLITL